ncbi:MAG TPA: hypothetical protein DCX19_07045 [Alphaproteobacteria bacterium]|nr:hypothetical protein [Alphaproteobacteria bacterium]
MNAFEIKEIFQNYPIGLLLKGQSDVKKIEKSLNKGHCFAAFDGENVVGAYVLRDMKDGSVEILNIVVAESARGKGLGKALLDDARDRAGNDGYGELAVTVETDAAARKFFEQNGFTVDADVETADGFTCLSLPL